LSTRIERMERWDDLVKAIEDDIPGFEICYKVDSQWHRFLAKISFWNDYISYTTTMYPKVWFESKERVEDVIPIETLEHEWVHLKDGGTFFGWLPFLPAKLNAFIFNALYILLLPWPGFFRAYAEIRAFRRSVEYWEGTQYYEPHLDAYVKAFTGPAYLFMWPFPKHVRKQLQKPSPYKDLMDGYYEPPV